MCNNWGWEILRRFQLWSDNVWIQAWFRSVLTILKRVTWLRSQGFGGVLCGAFKYFVCARSRKAAECPAGLCHSCPGWGCVCDELTALDRNNEKVLVHDVNRLSSNPAHNLLTLGLCCLQYQELLSGSLFYWCLHILQLPGYSGSDSKLLTYVWCIYRLDVGMASVRKMDSHICLML